MKKIIVSKKEYDKLKRKAETDTQLVKKLVRSLEDIKQGRIKPWKEL